MIHGKCMPKMALLMFYPFRQLKDLTIDGSYWRQFHKQLQCHLKQKHTKFWENGFEILQNIEDRATLQKHVTRARDPITMVTINTKPDEATKKKKNAPLFPIPDPGIGTVKGLQYSNETLFCIN